MVEMSHRIQFGVEKKRLIKIEVDGDLVEAYEGESVAAALIASGIRVFRKTEKGEPRGFYCGIGQCQECKMKINNMPNTLACQTIVSPGCSVETNTKRTTPEKN